MNEQTRQSWLKTAAIIVILFGSIISLAAHPQTESLNGMFVDLAFWPFDGNPTMDAPATRLLCAIAGGLTMGWGIMIYLIVTKLHPKEPELASSILRTGIITWFLTDSAGSIVAGAPTNVLLNLGFLFMFLVPLLSTSKRGAAAN